MTEHYAQFLRRFRAMSLDKLHEIRLSLPESGCGWPRANYYRALHQVIAEMEDR